MKQWIERLVAWWRAIGRGPDTGLERLLDELRREQDQNRALTRDLFEAHTRALGTLARQMVEAVRAANSSALDPSAGLPDVEPLPPAVERAVQDMAGGDRKVYETLVEYAYNRMADRVEMDDLVDEIRRGTDLTVF